MNPLSPSATPDDRLGQAAAQLDRLRQEIRKVYIGQDALVEGALLALLAGGNLLLEGAPGLGKTLLVRTLAAALHLRFSRIQFTPDLMPMDITGGPTLLRAADGSSEVRFRPGPVFANVLLADEINRGTPRTQSALLEAMAEQAVTIAGERHPLDAPFLVIATQNPIEMEGTYPLPEAQLDRFLLKLLLVYPTPEELVRIGMETTGAGMATPDPVMDQAEVLALQALTRGILVEPRLAETAAKLVLATHPDRPDSAPLAKRVVRYGASPRAMQALIQAGRARALLAGRAHVAREDLAAAALPVLRHRIFLSFEANLEGISADAVVESAVQAAGLAR